MQSGTESRTGKRIPEKKIRKSLEGTANSLRAQARHPEVDYHDETELLVIGHLGCAKLSGLHRSVCWRDFRNRVFSEFSKHAL